jgi:glycosyltransferase involved in cell wall biosynthesis
MTTISAVIITKNEAKHIEACLQSLAGVADEIIVVDSFSEDETPDICRSYDAVFLQREWQGYSVTKNFANQMAASDYILSIDGDERLSSVLRESILREKENLRGIYSFNRLNHYLGKPVKCCGWYPDTKVRLFPREGTRWVGEVHEELVFSIPGQPKLLAGDLLHFPYDSVEEHQKQTLAYAQLGAEKLITQQKKGLRLKCRVSPYWRFLKMYIFQGGFLAGRAGWLISRMAMREVKLKYQMAIEMK